MFFSTSHVTVTRVKQANDEICYLKKEKIQNKTNCYLSTHPDAILSLMRANMTHSHHFLFFFFFKDSLAL